MSIELEFPLEFLVAGTPVSAQTQNPKSRERWKDRVREASRSALPSFHYATKSPISIKLFYFPPAEMQGDIDGIVKYTVDAMSKHIYYDGHQVERVVVQKFEPGKIFEFSSPSDKLLQALKAKRPVLYIRVSDDPHEELE